MSRTKTQATSKSTTPELASTFNGRPWLAAILLLYILFAIGYNAVTPAGTAVQHNPDENGHFQYIQKLASGHLPVFTTAAAGPEFHQPPLYYILCVPVYAATRALGDAASMHAVRAVSTVLGIFLILAAYRCARRLFPEQPWVSILTAGFVALLPMNVAMNASVANDSLTNMLVAVGLMLMVDIASTGAVQNPFPSGRGQGVGSILLGGVLGLLILTKSSALVLYPTVAVAFALLAYRKVLTPSTALRCAAGAIVVGILIGSPWLIRNSVLYGDPLGQRLFLKSFGNTAQADTFIRAIGFGPYEALVANWTFASFWGVFDQMTAWWGRDPHAPGYLSINAPLPPLYDLCGVVTGVAIIGVLISLRQHRPSPAQSSILWSLLVLVLATGYGFLMFTMTYFQAQGRYWFTSLIPFALFFALGIRGIFPREALYRVAVIVVILGLALLNAYTLFAVLIPRFSTAS